MITVRIAASPSSASMNLCTTSSDSVDLTQTSKSRWRIDSLTSIITAALRISRDTDKSRLSLLAFEPLDLMLFFCVTRLLSERCCTICDFSLIALRLGGMDTVVFYTHHIFVETLGGSHVLHYI